MQLTEAMQVQAKALADMSRFRMFQYIAAADQPVVVPELTDLLGFNHNAIRQHLAILVGAGLVTESTEQRKVRGRPRKLYGLRADALGAFGSVTGSYEQLAGLLLTVTTTGAEPFEVGRQAALDELVKDEVGEDQAVHFVLSKLAASGFEPTASTEGHITLQNCPFADVATKNQGIVCELHRGLVAGHLGSIDSRRSSGLEPRDPHRAGCIVSIGEPAGDPT